MYKPSAQSKVSSKMNGKQFVKSLFAKKKVHPEPVVHESLWKLLPFTYSKCLMFGTPLFNPSGWMHSVTFFLTLVPRCFVAWAIMKHDMRHDFTLSSINRLAVIILGFLTFWLLHRKRHQLVTFLASDASLGPKLKKFDRFYPLLFAGPLILHYAPFFASPSNYEVFRKKFLGYYLEFCPNMQAALTHLTRISTLIWFQLAPICAFLYSLGYFILYVYKFKILISILDDCGSMNFHSILKKLKNVAAKQEQFELAFGPFLFVGLCYNFLSAIYFILLILQIVRDPTPHLYSFALACLYNQVIILGLIILISVHNEKLKGLARFVASKLESNLAENSTYCSISYLQKRISDTINEPLTAWKMISVDRQVVLTIVTSCVSFSVLFIQINNGALLK